MKKVFLILAVVISTATTTVSAMNDEGVSSNAVKAFEKEFPGASSVKWEKIQQTDTYMVRFVYNNQGLLCYINEEGTVLATVRPVAREQLPFKVNETLNRKFGRFTISGIEELTMPADVSYLVAVENEKSKIYLRVYNNGSFFEMKKEKKKIIASLIK